MNFEELHVRILLRTAIAYVFGDLVSSIVIGDADIVQPGSQDERRLAASVLEVSRVAQNLLVSSLGAVSIDSSAVMTFHTPSTNPAEVAGRGMLRQPALKQMVDGMRDPKLTMLLMSRSHPIESPG